MMFPPWVIDMMHEHNVREAKRSLEAHVQFLEETKMSETKHDGKLPGGDTYEVYYDGMGKDAFVCIQGTHNLADHEAILEPKQALSLLAWLEENRTRLEQLAKEQDSGTI